MRLQATVPNSNPPTIGLFDSGVGGLTVLRALVDRIPAANYLYFGDTARLPYGSKSAATVSHYAVGAIRYLEAEGADLLVIACNTATALALTEIKSATTLPVVGVIEPGAQAAAAASVRKKVVVIGTEATIGSHAYRHALEGRKIEVREKACPLFVPLVEEGWADHPVTEQVARIYLSEAFSDGAFEADVLLLGCTHYPLIKTLLRRVAPAHIAIVDSAESTADEVTRQLGANYDGEKFQPRSESKPSLQFFATDSAEKFTKMGSRFLGLPVENVKHVDLKE
jgi:glutamate racemase